MKKIKKTVADLIPRLFSPALPAMLSVLICLNLPLYGEHVFLKDGSIIEGRVISDTGKGVTLKLPDGGTEFISAGKVLRTIYWKFTGEKSYIKLNSGELIPAYKVDEEVNTITLRKKLNVNDEFKLDKSRILNISGTMPLNLAGKVDGDNIVLSWESPLQAVKRFEIIVKKKGDKDFTPAGASDYTGFVFKKPENSTEYIFRVRSVDMKDDVSTYSNEITVKLDGTVLPVPEVSWYKTEYLDNEDEYILSIKWNNGKVSSRSVEKYRIFIKQGNAYRVVGESVSGEITIRYSSSGIDPNEDNVFVIRSVSASGLMSGDSDEFKPAGFLPVKLPRIRVGGGAAYLGDSTLNQRYGMGYGVFADIFSVRQRFKKRYYFSHGIDAGFRGMYRVFRQDDIVFTSVENPLFWANTMSLYSCDLFIRYSAGFLFLGEHWDFYVSASPRFLYSDITTSGKPDYTGGNKSYNYKSYGAVGGAGFECTLFKWSGIFAEYNYGFVPLDSDGKNVEGHQFYAGIIMRQ